VVGPSRDPTFPRIPLPGAQRTIQSFSSSRNGFGYFLRASSRGPAIPSHTVKEPLSRGLKGRTRCYPPRSTLRLSSALLRGGPRS
jgi:hypothetical protein